MSPLLLLGALIAVGAVLGGGEAKAETPPTPGRRPPARPRPRQPFKPPPIPPPTKPTFSTTPGAQPTVLDTAMRACITAAVPQINAQIDWQNDAGKAQWATKLQLDGFKTTASCIVLEGEDLAVCLGLLPDAIEADLVAMATPITGPAKFAELANHLEAAGFAPAAACFR